MAIKRKINIADKRTWQKYYPEMCTGCSALCCYMPCEVKTSDLVRLGLLSEFDDLKAIRHNARILIKKQIIKTYREKTGIFVLGSNSSGACIYLDKNARCTVYDKRPDTCRLFPDTGSRPGFCPAKRK